MYNLIVSGFVEDIFNSRFDIEQNRFLEYTSAKKRSQLMNLSTEAIECLKSWPCILMQEGRAETVVHVAQIITINNDRSYISLTLSSVSSSSVIVNADLWRLRQELDIAEFEFSRNHWAVKDCNLFLLLESAGHQFIELDKSKFENKTFPVPSRRELLQSRDIIGNWSHTEIDDFLLEGGVSSLEASRAVGSRRDRANAIIEFAFNNPQATTAENSLFTVFILRKTSIETESTDNGTTDFSGLLNISGELPARRQFVAVNRVPNRVFVVHGQNETVRTAVVAELNRLGLEPIVLHEQPNMGRHLLTKFIEEAELVTFAVVIMTDDDVGSIKEGTLLPRARQNVILELGYFLAHLGQPRVCALISPGLETPSDFDGIVYIRMDERGIWQIELERELRAAGIPIANTQN